MLKRELPFSYSFLLLSIFAVFLLYVEVMVWLFLFHTFQHETVERIVQLILVYPTALLIPALLLVWPLRVSRRKKSRKLLAAYAIVILSLLFAAIYPSVAQIIWMKKNDVPAGSPFSFALNRGNYSKVHTVVYTHYPEEVPLYMDVWDPGSSSRLRPALVRIHGWGKEETRTDFTGWNEWFNSLGYVVFDVEYRPVTPHSWKDGAGDIKAALFSIYERSGTSFHVDTNRIVLMGSSAGATMALLAACTSPETFSPSFGRPTAGVRCIIDLYGPADLVTWYHQDLQSGLFPVLGGSPVDVPERYTLLSPVTHISEKTPPVLIIHGMWDRTCPPSQSILLDETLEKHGVRHESYFIPAAPHAFDLNWNSLATQVARDRIRNFLLKNNK